MFRARAGGGLWNARWHSGPQTPQRKLRVKILRDVDYMAIGAQTGPWAISLSHCYRYIHKGPLVSAKWSGVISEPNTGGKWQTSGSDPRNSFIGI